MNNYTEMADVGNALQNQSSLECLIVLKQASNKFGVTRLRFNSPSAHQLAFIAYNFESLASDIYISRQGVSKPFIEGFDTFYKWIEEITPDDTIINNLLKPKTEKWKNA